MLKDIVLNTPLDVQPPSLQPPQPPKREVVISGTALLFGRQIISLILKFIGLLVITRMLAPEHYGVYSAAFSIYSYVLAIGFAGVSVYLLRQPGALPDIHYRTASTMLFVFSITIVVLFMLCSDILARYVGLEGFGHVFILLLMALPFQIMTSPPMVYLERNFDYRSVAFIEIIGQLVYYAIIIPFLIYGASITALAWGWIAQHVVCFVIVHVRAKRAPMFGWNSGVCRLILSYSLPFSISNWIWQLRILILPLIVAPTIGAHATGLVAMVIGLLTMLGIVNSVIWRVSVASLAHFQHDASTMCRTIREGMEANTLIVGILILGFSWFGGWIVPFVFGAKWLPILDIYPYIAVSCLTTAMFNMHSAALSVVHRNSFMAYYHVVHIALFAGAAFIFVPMFGMKGYGLGELAAVPSVLIVAFFVKRTFGSIQYRCALLWWGATVIGLFWRELEVLGFGKWAIAVPLIVLALPVSWPSLNAYWHTLIKMLKRKIIPFDKG